jgi:large subunit ribosomal protein L29
MTKQTDALNELRRMTVVELDDRLSKQRRRLFEVRFQQATGQVENHRQVREIRHEIARAMTVKIEAGACAACQARRTPRGAGSRSRRSSRRRVLGARARADARSRGSRRRPGGCR